ncbi:MAG: hypothetical protein U5L96_21570 [Owenweeksia sp.]|nr:hypothetical protein [Owenweeksia sp.]
MYLIFKAKMRSDYFHLTPERTEIAFFSPEDIPWKELAFSSNSFAIKKFMENDRLDTTTHIGSYFKKNKINAGSKSRLATPRTFTKEPCCR